MTIIKHIPFDFPDSMTWDRDRIANCCINCSKHPINGGTEICYCNLPLETNVKLEKSFEEGVYIPC